MDQLDRIFDDDPAEPENGGQGGHSRAEAHLDRMDAAIEAFPPQKLVRLGRDEHFVPASLETGRELQDVAFAAGIEFRGVGEEYSHRSAGAQDRAGEVWLQLFSADLKTS